MKVDYDILERMHKQEGWTRDQERHFEAGWEAAMRAKGDEWAKEILFDIRHELRESLLAFLSDNSHDGPWLPSALLAQLNKYCTAMEELEKEQDE